MLLDFVEAAGYRVIAFFDNDPATASQIKGVPIHHGARGFKRWLAEVRPRAVWFTVAIGGGRGAERLAIQQMLIRAGLRPATLVHPGAIVSSSATIGDGAQVLAGSVIGPRCRLGAATIVNTRASVDHECAVGAGSHVAPGAVLAGCVSLGKRVFIGAGAVVLPRLKIGDDACVGAGAVVTKDVAAGAVVVGNPAAPIRRSSKGKAL